MPSASLPPSVAPTWRPPVVPPPPPPDPGPRWRREAAPPTSGRWARRLRLALVALAFLLCTGMLVWALFWLKPPRPASLVLVGAGYETNLSIPHNVYGRESLKELADLSANHRRTFVWQSGLLRLKHEPLELQTDTAWDKGLNRVDEKTVIVYLALHGGADAEGAYLLPQDADAQDVPKNRLRVAQVLDRLAALPADRNKVLILDATQVPADWSLGMLHNDFARALEGLEPRIEGVKNLVVLSSSGPDQRSWVSPELRTSIFAHHLIEGLRGAADENADGRINALELYRYAAASVERWARINRGALQTPVLLPWGHEGEDRARAMHLTMVEQPYQPPEASAHTTPALPDKLTEVWKHYWGLDAQVPSPAVYTPQLWQQYEATVLRYEQLLRAGDPTDADTLAERLHDLERDIDQARRLELSSNENTLAMYAVTGSTASLPGGLAASEKELEPALDDLWGAAPAEVTQKWADLQKAKAPDAPAKQLLRLGLMDLIARRASQNPADNLDTATRLLTALRDPLRPVRPAELHYLALTWRDLPQKPPSRPLSELLHQALVLRLQAEQTALAVQNGGHAYSEQVAPWLQAQVDEADQERRLGEDLLFANDSTSWESARTHFQNAQTLYEAARQTATPVRTALGVRDRVLAHLPAYSRWLAERPRPADPLAQKDADALLQSVEDLWDRTHRLTDLLEGAATLAPLGWRAGAQKLPVPDVQQLRQLAEDVDRQFTALERQFADHVDDIRDSETLPVWAETEAVLAVPIRNVDRRKELLALNGRISQRFLGHTSPEPGSSTPTPENGVKAAQDSARRQGHMALAVLGKRWFDQPQGPDRRNYTVVGTQLETFAGVPSWWEILNQAQNEVGYRWQQLPATIAQDLETSRKPDLDKARSSLREADRLVRQLGGAPGLPVPADPAGRYRRVLVHDLLLWQAGRSLGDHWFAEDDNPNARAYYQTAGLAYLEDAARQVTPMQAQASAQELQDELAKPGRLVLKSTPGSLDVTSETRFGVDYQVQPEAGAMGLAGYPVFQVDADQALKLISPDPGTRVVWELRTDRTGEPIRCELSSQAAAQAEGAEPPAPRLEQVKANLHGYFRGQILGRATPVDLDPVPERIFSQFPGPQRGSVAVRTPPAVHQEIGEAAGAVAIILDCSGSMGEDPGKEFTPQTKYNQVTTALRAVLGKLPRGTTVSLWVFGQAILPAYTERNVEQTIRRIQAPVAWNGDAEQLNGLMTQVEYPALIPWNETPLLRTILQAKGDLADARGFKTILVLTDGMDNRWKTDATYNRGGRSVAESLRENFDNSGIVVNVVGFKFPNAEEAQAQQQFRTVEKLTPPGKFFNVKQVGDLAGVLELAMQQKVRYEVDKADNEPLALHDGVLDVGASGANDQWFPGGLNAGGYKVRVRASQNLEQDVMITPGDLLLLNLANTPKGQAIKRVFVTRDVYGSKPHAEEKDWRLAVLQNQRLGERHLQMLAMLEKDPDFAQTVLQQVRPREAWFDLDPAGGGKERYTLRWSYQAGYTAPAWDLDVAQWPARGGVAAPDRPVLRAWWDPNEEAPAAAAVVPDATLRNLLNVKDRPVSVNGINVTLESVRVEKHTVQIGPNQFEARDCLVVRMSYPPDLPVKVRVQGLNAAGQEHRYYRRANKYAALFWPVSEAQARDALTSIDVISLKAFKDAAKRNGYYLELDKLGEPQVNDVRPQPPIPLR